MEDLASLKEWVKNGQGTRTVEIKIGNFNDFSFIHIWAYDYTLQEGQIIKSADEINLEKIKQEDEMKLYEKLKLKYEGAQ